MNLVNSLEKELSLKMIKVGKRKSEKYKIVSLDSYKRGFIQQYELTPERIEIMEEENSLFQEIVVLKKKLVDAYNRRIVG